MATKNDDKYIVDKFLVGRYEYNTIFITKGDVEYQIPVIKGKKIKEGDEIVIQNIFEPIK